MDPALIETPIKKIKTYWCLRWTHTPIQSKTASRINYCIRKEKSWGTSKDLTELIIARINKIRKLDSINHTMNKMLLKHSKVFINHLMVIWKLVSLLRENKGSMVLC